MKKPVWPWLALTVCALLALGLVAQGTAARRERSELEAALQEQKAAVGRLEATIQERETALQELETALQKQKAVTEEARTEAETLRYALSRTESLGDLDNPIDRYWYSEKRGHPSATIGIAAEESFYRTAWQEELDHAIAWIRENSGTTYQEDIQLLEDFRERIGKIAEASEDLAGLHVAEFPPEQRSMHMGTIRPVAVVEAEASVYRAATLWLLDTYAYAIDKDAIYSYAFGEDTVDRAREELGDLIVDGKSVFPPFSETLGDDAP